MNLFKSLSVYTFVGFFGAGINFLLMPILSHHMSPGDYGISALINTYVTLIIPAVSLVAYGLIGIEYYHQEDKKEFASLFSSISFIPVLPTLLFLIVGWAGYEHFAGPLELPANSKWWTLSVFPLAAMSIYIDTAANYQVIAKEAKIYAAYNILKVVCEVLLTLLFVVKMQMGWRGRILAWIVASIIFTGLGFVYFKRKHLLTTNIKWKYIWQGLVFGAPLILHVLGKFVVNQSDRIFISKMVSVDEAGIYSVGYTIGTVMLIIATALSNISGPYIMERLKSAEAQQQRQIRKLTYAAIAALLVILLLLNVISPLLFKYLMAEQYANGAAYVLWVSIAYLFWGMYLLFATYIYFYKKNNYLVLLAITNIVTNILFNYFFIKLFGGIGAAYATALSFLINLILMLLKVFRMLPWLKPRISDFRLN